jgi:hypothetical protein
LKQAAAVSKLYAVTDFQGRIRRQEGVRRLARLRGEVRTCRVIFINQNSAPHIAQK